MSRVHAIDVGGLTLSVTEAGKGPPVVLAHGILFDHRMFDALVEDLARDHRTVAVDLRGHGRSSPVTAPYTLADQAQDLARVLDGLGLERAVFVGHSMGAMSAMRLAAEAPERVEGLVVVNSSAEEESRVDRLRYRAMARVFRHLGPSEVLLGQVVGTQFSKGFQLSRAAVVREWVDRWKALDRVSVYYAVKAVVSRPSIEGLLPKIRCPSLVLAGTEDVATDVDRAQVIQDGIPDCRRKEIQGCGHAGPVEKPAEMLGHIREYLDELRGGKRDLRTGFRAR